MIHLPFYSCTMNYTVFRDGSPGTIAWNDTTLTSLYDKMCFLNSPLCHQMMLKIFLQMTMWYFHLKCILFYRICYYSELSVLFGWIVSLSGCPLTWQSQCLLFKVVRLVRTNEWKNKCLRASKVDLGKYYPFSINQCFR